MGDITKLMSKCVQRLYDLGRKCVHLFRSFLLITTQNEVTLENEPAIESDSDEGCGEEVLWGYNHVPNKTMEYHRSSPSKLCYMRTALCVVCRFVAPRTLAPAIS